MSAQAFDLEHFFPFKLNNLAEQVSLRFAACYKKMHSMTRPEWRVLAVLGHYGCLTATETSRISTMHKTKVSRAVFSLEQRRWLKRAPDVDDRRNENLQLTSEGKRRFRELSLTAIAYQEELRQIFGPSAFDSLNKGLIKAELALQKPKRVRSRNSRQTQMANSSDR